MSGGQATGQHAASPAALVRRLRRAERREQILDAATRAFARAGFAAAGLDDVAAEAGITRGTPVPALRFQGRLIPGRPRRACSRIAGIDSASADPDAFRLLFRYAAREPEFRDLTDSLTASSIDIARRNLATLIRDGPWLGWGSLLIPALTIEPSSHGWTLGGKAAHPDGLGCSTGSPAARHA